MTKFDKIKNAKIFALPDIVIYVLLGALIVALFAGFVWGENPSLTAVSAWVSSGGENEEIFVFDFEKGLSVAEGWENRVVVAQEDNKSVTIEILFDDGKNILLIDKAERWAKMTESDCSFHHDCTLFPPITSGGGVIICLPRGLTVRGEGAGGDDIQPSVG